MREARCGSRCHRPRWPEGWRTRAARERFGRVTLTADAVRRLGIETAEVELQEVRPTRTYSGELSVPFNQQTTITTVVAGFIQLDHDTVPGERVRVGQRSFRLTARQLVQSGAKSMDPQR